MSNNFFKIKEAKRQSQEAYWEAVQNGKIKPQFMHKSPEGIIPRRSEGRLQPNFSFGLVDKEKKSG